MFPFLVRSLRVHWKRIVSSFVFAVTIFHWVERYLRSHFSSLATTPTIQKPEKKHDNNNNTNKNKENKVLLIPFKTTNRFSVLVLSLWMGYKDYFSSPIPLVCLAICAGQLYDFGDARSLKPLFLFATLHAIQMAAKLWRPFRLQQKLNSEVSWKVTEKDEITQVSQAFPAMQLCRGNLVELSPERQPTADILLVHFPEKGGENKNERKMFVNESSLTGEFCEKQKTSISISQFDVALELKNLSNFEKDNIVFRGTCITSGSCLGVVLETGNECSFLQKSDFKPQYKYSLLEQKLFFLSLNNLLLLIGLVLVFGCALYENESGAGKRSWWKSFRQLLLLWNSLIPLSLQCFLTVFAQIHSWNIARKSRAKNRGLADAGLEFQHEIQCVVSDKTGTLTENAKVKLHRVDGKFDPEAFMALTELAVDSKGNVLCTDPLELAILNFYNLEMAFNNKTQVSWKGKVTTKTEWKKFDHALGYKSVIVDDTIYYQGSEEGMRTLGVSFPEFSPDSTLTDCYERVIYCASAKEGKDKDKDKDKKSPSFVCRYVFHDFLVPGISESVRCLVEKGLGFAIVSGDSLEANLQVARCLGFTKFSFYSPLSKANSREKKWEGTGTETAKGKGKESEMLVVNAKDVTLDLQTSHCFLLVYRASPQQKHVFVQGLNRRGVITCYIGDGVNDLLALREAHLGVSVESLESCHLIRESSTFAIKNWNSLPVCLEECEQARNSTTMASFVVMEKHFLTSFALLGMFWVSKFSQLQDPFSAEVMMLFNGLVFAILCCYFLLVNLRLVRKEKVLNSKSNLWRAAFVGLLSGNFAFSVFESQEDASWFTLFVHLVYLSWILFR